MRMSKERTASFIQPHGLLSKIMPVDVKVHKTKKLPAKMPICPICCGGFKVQINVIMTYYFLSYMIFSQVNWDNQSRHEMKNCINLCNQCWFRVIDFSAWNLKLNQRNCLLSSMSSYICRNSHLGNHCYVTKSLSSRKPSRAFKESRNPVRPIIHSISLFEYTNVIFELWDKWL